MAISVCMVCKEKYMYSPGQAEEVPDFKTNGT